MHKRTKTIPLAVLDRARKLAKQARPPEPRSPPPPTPPRALSGRPTREKIVDGLKKLHPMD